MLRQEDREEFKKFLKEAQAHLLDENIVLNEDNINKAVNDTYGSDLIREKTIPKKVKRIIIKEKTKKLQPNPEVQLIIDPDTELKKVELLKEGLGDEISQENISKALQSVEQLAQLNEQKEKSEKLDAKSLKPDTRAEKLIYKKVFGDEFKEVIEEETVTPQDSSPHVEESTEIPE